MGPNNSRWSKKQSEAFWSFVRGRMAERRLTQEQVAKALNFERSTFTRRLSGETAIRPTELMIERLGAVLTLGDAEQRRLHELAGYETAAPAAGDIAETAALPVRPAPRRAVSGRLRLGLLLGAIVLLAGVAVMVATGAGIDRPSIASQPRVVPGGLWVSPANGETVSGTIHFAARAYATNPGDPAIARVNFTLSWAGAPGPWLIACQASAPVQADVYRCDFDPAAVMVPAGQLRISFDVYDRAKKPNVNFAPHGVRTITYVPTRSTARAPSTELPR